MTTTTKVQEIINDIERRTTMQLSMRSGGDLFLRRGLFKTQSEWNMLKVEHPKKLARLTELFKLSHK